MKPLKNNERGLSLVEVTIMLLVLMLLTGVLAPSMFDFINDAKWVKVKEDCEAIGLSVARLTRDVGPCLKLNGSQGCTMQNRVDLLHSDGPVVTGQNIGASAPAFSNGNMAPSSLNWDSTHGDSMENQFVSNGAGYGTPLSLGSGLAGLQTGLGWRGAYLSPPIGSDPWGQRYLVNSAFLAVATDASLAQQHGHQDAFDSGAPEVAWNLVPPTPTPVPSGWSHNTFCISAGPNSVYETAIGGNANGGVNRMGDDFIFIISGGTR